MLTNKDENNIIISEENKLLGKKKERDEGNYYFSKEEAFSAYEFKSKNIPNDIELIKSYSKNLFSRLNQSPIEIINIIVSPFTQFSDYFVEIYDKLLNRIQHIQTNKKLIIKYMYNNGIMHNEPVTFPCDSNEIKKNENNDDINTNKNENGTNMEDDNNNNENSLNNLSNELNPHYVTLNAKEVWTSLKDYKWEGLIKIIIIFGENGFCKQIIKNIDSYHNNYLLLNLHTITPEQKAHFNNIINGIYSFNDIIGCLKQDVYDHSIGKNNIKEISEKLDNYKNILQRYLHYDITSEAFLNNDKSNIICLNFYKKNIVDINKNDIVLFDFSSSSKSFLCSCYTSKIKREFNNESNLPNFLKPNYIVNKIGVELSISNNIYHILNNDYNDDNLNIHINNLTLGSKFIGYALSKLNKYKYNQEYFINNTLLNFAICDYICDLFNMRLFGNNINLNVVEIQLYEFTNYDIPYLIGKKYNNNYIHKYDKDLLDCFSHFSFCITYGQLIIDNIKEYNGYIYLFDIFKDSDEEEFNEYKYINIFRFFTYHKCNKYCEILGLNKINKNFYNINPDDWACFENKRICDICKKIFEVDKKYEYNKDNLCLCFECHNKIYSSNYVRVCCICGKKFEYFYNFYILQKIDPPSICKECEKIKINEHNSHDDNINEPKNSQEDQKLSESN